MLDVLILPGVRQLLLFLRKVFVRIKRLQKAEGDREKLLSFMLALWKFILVNRRITIRQSSVMRESASLACNVFRRLQALSLNRC